MTTKTTTQEDFEMSRYILNILKQQRLVVMSWGFHNPTVISDGLQFNVQGFIHTGLVQIVYQQGLDLFMVRLLSKDFRVVKEIDRLYFDQLVEVIDENVERVKNYNERVKQEYSNIHFYQ